MSSSPIQKGGPYLVGYGSFKYTGYVPQDGMVFQQNANATNITDENGASMNWVFENPRDEITADFVIATSVMPTPPKPGDVISIIKPNGSTTKNFLLVQVAPIKLGRLHAILTLTLMAEDSMSGSYTT